MANWCVPTDKLLNCVMCSRKVITNDPEKQFVPQRFIFSPWLPVGSAVLITMLCNFIALFLLKAQIWVDMAHRKLHRWRSTVSTALTAKLIWLTNKCSYLKIKNKYKKLRKMTERRWIFIPNSVTAIWKDKTSEEPELLSAAVHAGVHLQKHPAKPTGCWEMEGGSGGEWGWSTFHIW